MKSIGSLLTQTKKKLDIEDILINLLIIYYPEIKKSNFHIQKGLLVLSGIPSSYRFTILIKKKEIIKTAESTGIYLRDIL